MSQRVPQALLALADGSLFHGWSVGREGISVGEVVFNTAMTGYQEILSDPSYARQIVTFTYPHIGNTGVNEDDVESSLVQVAGIVVRDVPVTSSSHRQTDTLSNYLKKAGVLGIAGIDTRSLTRVLRQKGSQHACLMAGDIDEQLALVRAREFSGLKGVDLAKSVATTRNYLFSQGIEPSNDESLASKNKSFSVVVIDYGTKRNILRLLESAGCSVTVVSPKILWTEIAAMNPDGVLFSNGPGDPTACHYAIDHARGAIVSGIPTFGICLGHQILALALGAKTEKMSTGHHGANHPVKDLTSGRVYITSQNHGFAVSAETLPANARVTHVSLFDGTLQGFELIDKPVRCFQGHPEAAPGPNEMSYLFDRFVADMQLYRHLSKM